MKDPIEIIYEMLVEAVTREEQQKAFLKMAVILTNETNKLQKQLREAGLPKRHLEWVTTLAYTHALFCADSLKLIDEKQILLARNNTLRSLCKTMDRT